VVSFKPSPLLRQRVEAAMISRRDNDLPSQAVVASESDSALAESPRKPRGGYLAKSAEAFRSAIGEALRRNSAYKTHVLRFWETEFDNLRPMKRADGRRSVSVPKTWSCCATSQNLLHVQGLTIRGAIKALDGGAGGGCGHRRTGPTR